MSKEGDRATVFRTTKVRTKLKGDASWLQCQGESQDKTQEEKPWMAEVRASRLNGAPDDTSPVSSPTKSTPSPSKSETESRAPTAGYLIRGVFTKLDNPPSTSTSNGINRTTQFTKRPSEGYTKIAPHTVKPTLENQESHLSPEELEKRTEAASSVLQRSSVQKRSYVLSAAKKYEAKEESPDTSLVNSSPSFVATRVVISDDDESAATPAPSSTVPPSPVVPATSADSELEPKPRKIGNTTVKAAVDLAVNEPVAPKVKKATPEPEKEVNPQPEESGISGPPYTPLVKLLPPSTTPVSPAPSSTVPESPVPVPRSTVSKTSPASERPAPVLPTSVSAVTNDTVKTKPESKPELKLEPEPEPDSKPSPEPSSSVDTHAALFDTLIPFESNSSSVKDDEPALTKEERGSADSHTTEDSVEQGPAPALSNGEPLTDDLLGFCDGPEESAEPVPPSPGRWSQDLLGELDSESNPAKTGGPLDLLANDVIVIHREAHSLNMKPEEKKQTDETAKETQSSADPFDPYPIGTTSHNSSSDLLQPLSNISINSSTPSSIEIKSLSPEINMGSNALESLADDIVPIPTDNTSPRSQRSWTRTWEASAPEQANTEESQKAEAEEEGQAKDQDTLIMFERKSTENNSPWDKWTSPTVYTITTSSGEEGEEEEEEEEGEEESPEDIESVTTITTVREIHKEPEPAMDRSMAYSRTVVEEEQRVQTPEPETKKGFVYVKEYVNATELSLHNPRDTIDSGSDYLPSRSTTQSFSSLSSASLSSTCTYCGEQVGNDAKITIEHLNINCHPDCFKCELCRKPMGDLLSSMFLHGGRVHCESCYSSVI